MKRVKGAVKLGYAMVCGVTCGFMDALSGGPQPIGLGVALMAGILIGMVIEMRLP